jgi:hypothetical protein
MGVTGRLTACRGGEYRFTVADIERGAQLTVTDSPTRGLVVERYKEFSRDKDDDDVGSIR